MKHHHRSRQRNIVSRLQSARTEIVGAGPPKPYMKIMKSIPSLPDLPKEKMKYKVYSIQGLKYKIFLTDIAPSKYHNKDYDRSMLSSAISSAAHYMDDYGRQAIVVDEQAGSFGIFGGYNQKRRYRVYYL